MHMKKTSTFSFHACSRANLKMDDWPQRMVADLVSDVRSRLETKIFDVNRTLANLTASRIKSVDVDGVHRIVFARAFPSINHHCVLRDLESVAQMLSPAALLRCHRSGDFCLVAPLQKCAEALSSDRVAGLLDGAGIVQPVWMGSNFSVAQGQVVMPLCRHGLSSFIQVACPYPGEDECVEELLYPSYSLPTLCHCLITWPNPLPIWR